MQIQRARHLSFEPVPVRIACEVLVITKRVQQRPGIDRRIHVDRAVRTQVRRHEAVVVVFVGVVLEDHQTALVTRVGVDRGPGFVNELHPLDAVEYVLERFRVGRADRDRSGRVILALAVDRQVVSAVVDQDQPVAGFGGRTSVHNRHQGVVHAVRGHAVDGGIRNPDPDQVRTAASLDSDLIHRPRAIAQQSQRVGLRVRVDPVRQGTGQGLVDLDRVITGSSADQDRVPFDVARGVTAIDRVAAGAADEQIFTRAAVQYVVATAAVQLVPARAAVDRLGVIPAAQHVVAIVAVQLAKAGKRIVALAAVDHQVVHVGQCGAEDGIQAVRGKDQVVAFVGVEGQRIGVR